MYWTVSKMGRSASHPNVVGKGFVVIPHLLAIFLVTSSTLIQITYKQKTQNPF